MTQNKRVLMQEHGARAHLPPPVAHALRLRAHVGPLPPPAPPGEVPHPVPLPGARLGVSLSVGSHA